MKLQAIDISILISYLAAMVMIGWLLRKKARVNKESYLLGGKKLPWYLLGLSDASDMFDISGTMWMVALCFVYGMKSIWIPWLWPVFNQVFNMMFLAKWLRRSNVSTGAEWLATRFGLTGKGVKASHTVVVAFALIGCFGFLAYGFVGLGKFIEIFIPWNEVKEYVPFDIAPQYVAHFYGIIFTLFAVFYSVLGGMHSIVLGDLIKYIIMTVGCISIAVIAMLHLNEGKLNVPQGWFNPFFGWHLDLGWSAIIPDADKKINSDGFGLFGFFFMMMLFKGAFAALAGPAPNYDMETNTTGITASWLVDEAVQNPYDVDSMRRRQLAHRGQLLDAGARGIGVEDADADAALVQSDGEAVEDAGHLRVAGHVLDPAAIAHVGRDPERTPGARVLQFVHRPLRYRRDGDGWQIHTSGPRSDPPHRRGNLRQGPGGSRTGL